MASPYTIDASTQQIYFFLPPFIQEDNVVSYVALCVLTLPGPGFCLLLR